MWRHVVQDAFSRIYGKQLQTLSPSSSCLDDSGPTLWARSDLQRSGVHSPIKSDRVDSHDSTAMSLLPANTPYTSGAACRYLQCPLHCECSTSCNMLLVCSSWQGQACVPQNALASLQYGVCYSPARVLCFRSRGLCASGFVSVLLGWQLVFATLPTV